LGTGLQPRLRPGHRTQPQVPHLGLGGARIRPAVGTGGPGVGRTDVLPHPPLGGYFSSLPPTTIPTPSRASRTKATKPFVSHHTTPSTSTTGATAMAVI